MPVTRQSGATAPEIAIAERSLSDGPLACSGKHSAFDSAQFYIVRHFQRAEFPIQSDMVQRIELLPHVVKVTRINPGMRHRQTFVPKDVRL